MSRYRVISGSLFLAAMGVVACSSGGTNDTGSGTQAIALTLDPTSATVVQGDSVAVSGTLTRSGGFGGEVTIAVSALPVGVTVSVSSTIPAGSTSASGFVHVATTAAVGVDTITVSAQATGVTTAAEPFVLTITAAAPPPPPPPPAPHFDLSMAPDTVTMAQGGNASAALRVARSGGFAGTVSVQSSGAPAGLDVAVTPTAVPDSDAIAATAAMSVAPGSYPVTLRGSSDTLTSSAILTVIVTPAPTVRLDYSACAARMPLWLAYQAGTGPWVVAQATGLLYTLPQIDSATGTVATVDTASYEDVSTTAFFESRAEFNAGTANAGCVAPALPSGKTVYGSVVNLPDTTASAEVFLGGSFAATSPPATDFTLTNVAAGSNDLVATTVHNHVSPADRFLIVRDLDPASGDTLPPLDLSQSVPWATQALTFTNSPDNLQAVLVGYGTGPTCTVATIQSLNFVSSGVLAIGVPAQLQRPTDYHIFSTMQQGYGERSYEERWANVSFHAMGPHTIDLGPGIGTPTVTLLSPSFGRLRAAFTMPAPYSNANMTYSSLQQTMNVYQSAGYIAGKTSVSLTTPDLTALPGYQAGWSVPTGSYSNSVLIRVFSTQPATMCAEGAGSWQYNLTATAP